MNHSNSQVFRCRPLLSLLSLLVASSGAFAADAAPNASGGLQTAGELIVSLDARDSSAGTTNWHNSGSLGDFTSMGSPKSVKTAGQAAVQFNGTSDAYRSSKTVPDSLTEAHARSIEVWVNNPSLDSSEESMVAWGRRGTGLANMSFNYGSGGGFSAVTHYDQDMGWGDESPVAGEWHYLVYTYDGKTAKIYDNATERGSQEFKLVTAASHMNIAAENSADDKPLFECEFDNPWSLSLSGSIAAVRVESGALTPEQIKANFAADKDRFGAKAE